MTTTNEQASNEMRRVAARVLACEVLAQHNQSRRARVAAAMVLASNPQDPDEVKRIADGAVRVEEVRS